jgi:hypothetical protein
MDPILCLTPFPGRSYNPVRSLMVIHKKTDLTFAGKFPE